MCIVEDCEPICTVKSGYRLLAHLKAVSEKVGVCAAPAQRPELHDGDEAREIVDFPLQVLAVPHATQIEKLRA